MTPPEAVLRLRRSARELDPRALTAGRDLVLDVSIEQGTSVPIGVLIDDHLDLAAREAVDQAAHEMIAAWRRRVDPPLTIGAICLADVWHSELYAEVFLPVARIMAGVKAAAAAVGPGELVCGGLDVELVAALRAELGRIAVSAVTIGSPPTYPTEDAAPPAIAARQPGWQRRLRRTIEELGLPTVAWGDVLVLPYLSTLPVLARLTSDEHLRPVLHLGAVPDLALAVKTARTGGWLGLPGFAARRRGRAETRQALKAAAGLGPDAPGAARLAHVRAIECLAARALETTSVARCVQRAFGKRALRAVLLPFDHEPVPKTIIRLAQHAGVPTLFVQHGYEPYPVFHTGAVADFAAVWSAADQDAFPSERRANVRVVGNPRIAPGARAHRPIGLHAQRPPGRAPVAIVLAEHVARASSILDRRITAMHLRAALEGLRASSRDWQIVVRPHPVDDAGEFERLVAALGGEGVEVDGHSPAGELLSCADLCVGALSTMTLEAALAGVRVVMLNPQGVDWAPPLHAGSAVPTARDGPSLARAVDAAMAAADAPGAAQLIEALGGAIDDPAGQIVDWLNEIIGRRRLNRRRFHARGSRARA